MGIDIIGGILHGIIRHHARKKPAGMENPEGQERAVGLTKEVGGFSSESLFIVQFVKNYPRD